MKKEIIATPILIKKTKNHKRKNGKAHRTIDEILNQKANIKITTYHERWSARNPDLKGGEE